MTLIEAAKQARNMLEHIDLKDSDKDFLTTGECEELNRIITALDQAISEAEGAEWQGLTDEQIEELCWTEMDRRLLSFARAVEAKLKEKNHDTH